MRPLRNLFLASGLIAYSVIGAPLPVAHAADYTFSCTPDPTPGVDDRNVATYNINTAVTVLVTNCTWAYSSGSITPIDNGTYLAGSSRTYTISGNATMQAYNAGSWGLSWTFNWTQPAPSNTAAPTISGSTQFNQVLSASSGTWANSPTSYTYQWTRSATVSGTYTNISGANSSSYTTGTSDLNQYLKVTVTATNGAGSSSATSSATGPISPAASTLSVDFSGSYTFRTTKTLAATVSTAGKVTFTANNKKIPGCSSLMVNAGNSFTAVCNFRPAVHGSISLAAIFTPASSGYTGVTIGGPTVGVLARAGTR